MKTSCEIAKYFHDKICKIAKIPNAKYEVFTDLNDAINYLNINQ